MIDDQPMQGTLVFGQQGWMDSKSRHPPRRDSLARIGPHFDIDGEMPEGETAGLREWLKAVPATTGDRETMSSPRPETPRSAIAPVAPGR